ncbi:hypothetical protein [Stackebrandtia albiflava]|uniref:hypothetical protein n=1 Tax=Stackebrandtia albiflava TaxID=406432 RepID=UPI0011BEB23A|nr:hypothetical protein [Stackebrandtia albiflava]
MVRNSEVLDVMVSVILDRRPSNRAVELAGRGITAEAASTQWMLAEGKPLLNGHELADVLIAQGEIVDRFVELWRKFDQGEISLKGFEADLENVVISFEDWLRSARVMTAGRRLPARGDAGTVAIGSRLFREVSKGRTNDPLGHRGQATR